jgi:predicted ABC-type ATPase
MFEANIIIVGGTHGAGKSTLCRELSDETGYCYISPQQVNLDKKLTKNQTFKKILKLVEEMFSEKSSFIFEHVMSGGYIDKLIGQSIRNGYRIELIYIDIQDVITAMGRIDKRIRSGGHQHSYDETLTRLEESRRNFYNKYRKLCHYWKIYNNSGDKRKLVAEGSKEEKTIHEDLLFTSFEVK